MPGGKLGFDPAMGAERARHPPVRRPTEPDGPTRSDLAEFILLNTVSRALYCSSGPTARALTIPPIRTFLKRAGRESGKAGISRESGRAASPIFPTAAVGQIADRQAAC